MRTWKDLKPDGAWLPPDGDWQWVSEEIARAIARLTDREKRVLYLRHVLGLAPVEVAAILRISRTSERKCHERLMKRLRTLLRPNTSANSAGSTG